MKRQFRLPGNLSHAGARSTKLGSTDWSVGTSTMVKLLSDKNAVVTGGSSGIGRGIALSLAEHGANIVIADIQRKPRENKKPTDEVISNQTNVDVEFSLCDVTSKGDLEQAVGVADTFGGIDVMVNNAGIIQRKSFLEITKEEYSKLLNTNLRGTFLGSQVAAREMINSGEGGSIINIASDAARRGYGCRTTYCASKGGIQALTFAIADALGPHDIRVNTILPGLIETAMSSLHQMDKEQVDETLQGIPLRQSGKPKDIGNAAVFFASDLASFVSASRLMVDGGSLNTA